MSFSRLSLLSITAILMATAARAADPTPRLSALEAMGQQNLNSLHSDPRTGGPQGISISELPAADAYCQAKQVDALWAIRAGSTAPIPQFDLADPSHVPGVAGSRPFVSAGPISQIPGCNPRHGRPFASSPQLTQSEPAPASVMATSVATKSTPLFSSSFQRWGDAAQPGQQL